MRKLTISQDEKNRIEEEIRRSDDSRYDHRLHGILLVANGYSPYAVSEMLGDSPRSIENWVNSYRKTGFDGLKESDHPGRPSRTSGIMESIGGDLRKNPGVFGYSQNMWDGKLLSHHLHAKYGVDMGTRQCQRIFRKLDFRIRKPRPVIAKADEEKKDNFKKTPENGA